MKTSTPGEHERTSLLASQYKLLSLGTPLFPFHPRAATTPLWRNLLLLHFDGHRRVTALSEEDVWPLEPQFEGVRAASDLKKHLSMRGRCRLLCAVVAVNRHRLVVVVWLRLLALGLSMVQFLLLYRLVTKDSNRESDFTLLGGIAVMQVAVSFVECHRYLVQTEAMLKTFNGLYTMLTNRLIHGGSAAIASATSSPTTESDSNGRTQEFSQITAILVNDVEAIGAVATSIINGCGVLIRLAVSVTVLAYIADFAPMFLWIVVVFYVIVFATSLLVGHLLGTRADTALLKRVNIVHECLKGIQMIKLNAWEGKVETKILHARNYERTATNRVFVLSIVIEQLINASPMLFTAVVFVSSAWKLGSESANEAAFTPVRVFAVILLLTECLQQAGYLKNAIGVWVVGLQSARRIESILLSNSPDKAVSTPVTTTDPASKATVVVQMTNVSLSSPRTPSSTPTMLMNIDWKIHQGSLVVIHGPAGVGKSMLLAAIRQDHFAVKIVQGLVHTRPDCRVAYASQDPWLQALSIRDSILFGSTFNEDKYWAVVNACGLLEDLSTLREGDATAVGPRGINLSSGQCARIALARACYADADMYLLDCPLANVDAVVQSEIFRKCILELLMHKTVVIVTHNPEYIGSSYVDQLVHVQPLLVRVTNRASKNPGMSRRLRDYQHTFGKRNASDQALCISPLTRDSRRLAEKIESIRTNFERKDDDVGHDHFITSPATVVSTLFHAHRGYAVLSIVFASLWGVACVMRDVWIMKWASTSSETQGTRTSDDLTFAYLVGICILIEFATRGCIAALKSQLVSQLFKSMTHAILSSSMTLFYHTPIGETINRYFIDMLVVDEHLPRQLTLFALTIVLFLIHVVVVGWIVGLLGVLTLIMGYALSIRTLSFPFYLHVARLTTRTNAKMLNLMSEYVDGEAVIRSFGDFHTAHVFRAIDRMYELGQRVSYLNTVFNASVILYIDIVVGTLTLVLLWLVTVSDMSSALYGLVLLYIFMLQGEGMNNFCTGLLNTLGSFSSIQRLREYGSLPSEVDADAVATNRLVMSPRVDWPQHGDVVFERVDFFYPHPRAIGPTNTPALRNVSFTLRAGEKIGVIGRTGSGKSSIAMALLRVHPLSRGRVLVDGVDLQTLSLAQLRHSLTLIPQSPTFYRCSIRDYLDPFHDFEDGQLWREILTVELGGRVQSLGDALVDNGKNWSQGQRQLLCFARALLKPSRVVVLDEAFSCVDQLCQEKILKIVHERLRNSTVVLITHRLDQILAFDRILVMAAGQVVESGRAEDLARDPQSLFYEFLETSLLTL